MATAKKKAKKNVMYFPNTVDECLTVMKNNTLSVNFPFGLYRLDELEIVGFNATSVAGYAPIALFKDLFLHPEIDAGVCLAKACCFHSTMFIKGSVFQEQVVIRNTEKLLVWKHTGLPLDEEDAHDPHGYFERAEELLTGWEQIGVKNDN